MPRLPAIHDENLRRLAEELRYAPRSALLKHIERTETLASVIEPEQTYPPAWLVFRVTGFRPDHEGGAESPGASILESLSAFAEHLCESAGVEASECGDALTPEQLCDRWGIGRKSLDRARRGGLVGRRVRGDGPTRRLVFMPTAVEAYERRADPAPKPAGRRMSPAVRRKIIERARRYRQHFDCSINQAAGRLGPRFGFSPEAVRSALKRHDARAGANAIFREQGPPSAREQELAFRAARRGIGPEELAPRLGRPQSAVRRAALVRRADLLVRLELAGPGAEALERPSASGASLDHRSMDGPLRTLAGDLHGLLLQAREAPKPEPTAERALALAMHLVRARARVEQQRLADGPPEAMVIDRAETALRHASRLKECLVADSLGLLIATMERRLGHRPEELPPRALAELTRAMLTALAAAVDRFDPARGGRLAAPAGLALDRAAAAWMARATPDAHIAGRARRALAPGDPAGRLDLHFDPWQDWLEPDHRLRLVLDRLADTDANLLARRFGYGDHRPHTLEALSAWLGLPYMHTVRRERMALRAALAAARGTMLP